MSETSRRGRDPAGYAAVIIAYVSMSGTAPLVAWAGAPESAILLLRMALATLALGLVVARPRMLSEWRRPGAAPRLLLMAAISAVTLLLNFYAVRHVSVAIALFLLFLMPVWVALVAPRLLGLPREPIVWPALGLALAGLAVLLIPDLMGEGVTLSLLGLLAALLSGFGYASYAFTVKSLTRTVSSSTIAMAEAAGVSVLVLPLALWQLHASSYSLQWNDWVAAAVMGIFCTAISYTLWNEGARRVRVEHVTILGYVEPVSGVIFAALLLGQQPTLWTWLGGALILGAGLLTVVFGRGEGDAVAAAAEPEPL